MNKKYLEGKTIYLREIRESDVNDSYYQWLNNPEVNKYLETRFYPQTKDDILKFVKEKINNQNEVLFAICDKIKNIHLGNIKLGPINWIHRKSEISFFIGDKNYWGKGVATEAIMLIVKYAFEILNLHKVTAGYYITNKASAKVLRKCGFNIEGTLIQEYYMDGKFEDIIKVGLINNDYKK